MSEKNSWFWETRALTLAQMYLTRRTDLTVRRGTEEPGLDLVVTVEGDKLNQRGTFGVEVKAGTSVKDFEKISRFNKHQRALYDAISYPVCLLFFDVNNNDKPYYKWINEPVIDKSSSARLAPSDTKFKPLTNKGIESIVSKVKKWHERFNEQLHS